MTRDELKTKLEDMGVNLSLLEMPAVMERLYYMFDVEDRGPYQVEEVDKIVLDGEHYSKVEDAIKLDDEGNMILFAKDGSHIGRFSKDPYGEGATFVNENYFGAIYYIDEFGMDKKLNIRPIAGKFTGVSAVRTENSKFKIDKFEGKSVKDDGRPIINYQEIKNEFEFDRFRKALPSTRDNREYLIPIYPSVGRWYDEKVIKKKRKNLENKAEKVGLDSIPSMLDETLVGIDNLRASIEKNVLEDVDTEEGRKKFEREQVSMLSRMQTLQRQNEEHEIKNQRLVKSLKGDAKLDKGVLQTLKKGAPSKKANRKIIERLAPEMLDDKDNKK